MVLSISDQSNTPLSDKLQALNSKYDTLDIHQRSHIAVKASEVIYNVAL